MHSSGHETDKSGSSGSSSSPVRIDTPMSAAHLLWHIYHFCNMLTMSITAYLSLEAIANDTYYFNKSMGEDYLRQLNKQVELIIFHSYALSEAKLALLNKVGNKNLCASRSDFQALLQAADLLSAIADTINPPTSPLCVVEIQSIKKGMQKAYELMLKWEHCWKAISYGERLTERHVSAQEERWLVETEDGLEWQDNHRAVSSSQQPKITSRCRRFKAPEGKSM
ncbi:hypothetical protein AC578_6794 [Pseudocercospora eumusae]|uniref:Uncharacterized protein n=1 Tax=Pseudocercospora eumusae TaxID=321146 RepID=A0A139GVR2_9PEZI|nr:hypothetical protein AC578_6794 [Pseudocercospora eumusae]